MISPSEFIHPKDAAALHQLESIPGFPALVKKILELGYERIDYGVNMASNIRLSSTQMPNLYNHLPPICKKLGIKEPEFYLEMNPIPNAYTYGDTRTYITITSGLVEMLDDEELDAVIAHECGHILCRHVLYNTVAREIFDGANSYGLLRKLAAPIVFALLYWKRMSELSCDRCSAIITSPEVVTRVMVRLAGGPKSLTKDVNLEEWVKQVEEYEAIRTGNLWDRALQLYERLDMSHPFHAVRVNEIRQWGKNSQYLRLTKQSTMIGRAEKRCPHCGLLVGSNWTSCKFCKGSL